MVEGTVHGQKPQGCLRLLLKLPLWLYRAGLGWLLGRRFIMFRHVGRKTGKTHETVVEVLDHDPEIDRFLVASGWGKQADWYRNIMATPEVEVFTGRRSFDAVARPLPEDVAAAALCDYAARYPLAFRVLGRVLVGEGLDPEEADCRELARWVPVIAFERREAAEGPEREQER